MKRKKRIKHTSVELFDPIEILTTNKGPIYFVSVPIKLNQNWIPVNNISFKEDKHGQ